MECVATMAQMRRTAVGQNTKNIYSLIKNDRLIGIHKSDYDQLSALGLIAPVPLDDQHKQEAWVATEDYELISIGQ